MRPLHRTALQVALVLGFLPLSDRQPWLPPVTAEERSPLPNVPGITADWWSGVQSTLVAQEYAPSVADFGLQAPNRAQSFRSSFLADRITLGPRVVRTGQDWKFTWRTRRWGRAGAMQRLAPPATPAVAGARVRYER